MIFRETFFKESPCIRRMYSSFVVSGTSAGLGVTILCPLFFDTACQELLKARTTIIIVPGYRYRVIDAMFTNFHQPQSTLLLLVGAAVGEDWHKIYDYALAHDFRFLSYGDSSLLEVKKS